MVYLVHGVRRRSFARQGSRGEPQGSSDGLHRFAGNPYCFLGRRPRREAELRSYIVREHHLGRPLSEIVEDGYVTRFGSRTFCWRVVCQPETLAALVADISAARPSGPSPEG
jgi:hypothetical protein